MKKVAECLYINESSGTYFALVKRGGKQIRRSLGTQDRKLADRLLGEFRKTAMNLATDEEDRKLKFESLSTRWLKITNATLKASSALRNEGCVKRLLQTFEGKLVSGISRLDCERWMANRSGEISGRTLNYELQVLKRLFGYAMDCGIILSDPSRSLQPKKERKRAILVPTRPQFDSLVSALVEIAKGDARARHAVNLVKLLAFSGMRVGEATQIIWEEIDFDRNVFTVSGGKVGTKNGESRIVPLFPQLRSFLEELRANPEGFGEWETGDADRNEPTNFRKTGEPIPIEPVEYGGIPVPVRTGSGNPESVATGLLPLPLPKSRIAGIDSAKTALKTATRKAGLPHFDHHCLRHFFVSNAIERGIDFKTIAAWVGHRDGGLLVAKTYGHLRDVHSHEMAKRMV